MLEKLIEIIKKSNSYKEHVQIFTQWHFTTEIKMKEFGASNHFVKKSRA